jgi:hypothetical protein
MKCTGNGIMICGRSRNRPILKRVRALSSSSSGPTSERVEIARNKEILGRIIEGGRPMYLWLYSLGVPAAA